MKRTQIKWLRGSNVTEPKRQKHKNVVEKEDTDEEKGKDKEKGGDEECGEARGEDILLLLDASSLDDYLAAAAGANAGARITEGHLRLAAASRRLKNHFGLIHFIWSVNLAIREMLSFRSVNIEARRRSAMLHQHDKTD
jgi:hypothetical protein